MRDLMKKRGLLISGGADAIADELAGNELLSVFKGSPAFEAKPDGPAA